LPSVQTLADFPHLVAQLDRKKNGPVAPATTTAGSGLMLWWRCPEGPDHRWKASVYARSRQGTGCPFCANRAVSVTNTLSRLNPAVAQQWHPTRNGKLQPHAVVAGSERVVWWKCPKGPDHEWRAKIQDRHRGQDCPYCCRRRPTKAYNLAVALPAVAAEWHPIRNGELLPEDVTPQSSGVFWWKCSFGHEWSAVAYGRAKGNGCPCCSGRRVTPETSLATLRPALAREWHPTKNGRTTPAHVTPGSLQRVWWKCPEGPDHEWEATLKSRGRHACPFCSCRRVSSTNSLAACFPKVALEWHPTRNGELTPHGVVAGSARRPWWRCAFGHDWQATVSARTRGTGCMECFRLGPKRRAATTGARRRQTRLAAYANAKHGPVRRVKSVG
jgi:predicted secreted protein